jgi:hypothetical protein
VPRAHAATGFGVVLAGRLVVIRGKESGGFGVIDDIEDDTSKSDRTSDVQRRFRDARVMDEGPIAASEISNGKGSMIADDSRVYSRN